VAKPGDEVRAGIGRVHTESWYHATARLAADWRRRVAAGSARRLRWLGNRSSGRRPLVGCSQRRWTRASRAVRRPRNWLRTSVISAGIASGPLRSQGRQPAARSPRRPASSQRSPERSGRDRCRPPPRCPGPGAQLTVQVGHKHQRTGFAFGVPVSSAWTSLPAGWGTSGCSSVAGARIRMVPASSSPTGVQAAVRSDRWPAAGHDGPSVPGGSRPGDAHASTGDSPGCIRRPARLRDRHRGRRRALWGPHKPGPLGRGLVGDHGGPDLGVDAELGRDLLHQRRRRWEVRTVLDIQHLDQQARSVVFH
jgi:hypothetical protein